MASFGSFETEREIYSGPTYTVYGAKKQGDPKTEYAIKVFSVHHLSFGAGSAIELDPLLSDIERAYVERIAIQQKAAPSSKFVATIFETGRDERGVWYVTRLSSALGQQNHQWACRAKSRSVAAYHIVDCARGVGHQASVWPFAWGNSSVKCPDKPKRKTGGSGGGAFGSDAGRGSRG